MSTTIQVMIVDDHAIVAEGLEKVLNADRRLKVVGVAGTMAEARTLLERITPDIILLDLRLPDSQGLDTVRTIRERSGNARIVVLTGFPQTDEAELMGVDAYLDKQTASDVLLGAIRALFQLKPANEENRQPLTSRELQVAQLAADGLSNSEIAHRLFISTNTVKTHLAQVFSKLNVRDRVDLVRFWQSG
jgi:DNA-binding NarL/FixJ family response regulator